MEISEGKKCRCSAQGAIDTVFPRDRKRIEGVKNARYGRFQAGFEVDRSGKN